MKQRNTEHRRNSGTTQNFGGTTERYPEHQRNTPGNQQNTYVTPVEQWWNHTKRTTIVVFLRENLNFQLKVEIFFIADINYLFISLYLRLVYT